MHKTLAKLKTILLIALAAALLTGGAQAREDGQKTVRVGWYDSTYNTVDENGRRTGYAYEYQLKLAAYSGWAYEYVEGSWPDLLHLLETGGIDLMSDVSYTPAREEKMLYSSLPMGTEEYYIFTTPGRKDISFTDPAGLNGKKVGVNRDSIQAELYREWAERNAVEAELIEVSCTEEESLRRMEAGELDAYITVDSFIRPEMAVPVFKIGTSDYYFAVSKTRPDLLAELNEAMGCIQDENRFYNQQMFEKYIRGTGANAFLTADETAWLDAHGSIRVGYQDNYLAFCAADKKTGALTGALRDYLDYAADCIANAHIEFEAVAYPTAADAMRALNAGEVDCVFPANLSAYDAEQSDTVMSPALVSTTINAVVRTADPNIYTREKPVRAAVNAGNPNYDAFLAEHFPHWEKVYFRDTGECLRAVANGKADCLLISSFRFNNISRQCGRYNLSTFSVGVDMDYYFAVEKGRTELYSILAKTVNTVPDSIVNSAMSYYITEDARLTFADFLSDHMPAVLGVTGVVLLVILLLLGQNMRAVKTAKSLISATETDELTGLYNRNFFFQYANRRYREHPETPMDAVVLNIEQFHSINALHGHAVGDRVLRALGSELSAIARETGGIAGRFEADRFDLYCRHFNEYATVFDRLQSRLDGLLPTANLRLRMGVMPWREKMEPVQLFDRARTACNMARGHYKEHLIVYDEKVSDRESFEQRLVNDLRRALDAGEFSVYYQPKFNIRSDPPRLESAEALVRWNHPELGMVSPGDFIPLFEKNGQIGLLDKFVWTQAAGQVAAWRREYGVTVPVSVNLSRVDVFDPCLIETLDGILRDNGLDRGAFRLEVTESAYTENADQVVQVVRGLRERGYEVEMDDFGTGYSSLNMLSAMPVDTLKMDRAFIRNVEHSERDRQLVALILDIAGELKVPVIAEGVETETQLQLLRTLGCAQVQGYYFSRPLPAGDFESRFLTAGA